MDADFSIQANVHPRKGELLNQCIFFSVNQPQDAPWCDGVRMNALEPQGSALSRTGNTAINSRHVSIGLVKPRRLRFDRSQPQK